jgi:hypothetical protein
MGWLVFQNESLVSSLLATTGMGHAGLLRLGCPMTARHGPPHVGTMIWTSRATLGAGGRNGTDRVIHKRDEEPHRAGS